MYDIVTAAFPRPSLELLLDILCGAINVIREPFMTGMKAEKVTYSLHIVLR